MKILIVLIFINLAVFGQTGWYNIVTNVSDDLYSIYFTNTLTGFSCGRTGRILKTVNGGVTWDTLTSMEHGDILQSVYFINETTGYIAGAYCLYKTTNSGISWIRNPSFNDYFCQQIVFLNVNTGFAVGYYKLAKTINAGLNWTFDSYTDSYLRGLTFVNASTGYFLMSASFDCKVMKTTNTGNSWSQFFYISCYAGLSTHAPNESSLFVIGSDCYSNNFMPRAYCTVSSGSSWYSSNLSGFADSFKDIFFTSSGIGYVCGNYGIILKSNNGGVNWFNQTAGQGGPVLNELLFLNDSIGFSVGGNGKVKRTTDGGGPIGLSKISSEIPEGFMLHQNYPNPFNPMTKIRFNVPTSEGILNSDFEIKIYDILGREVSILLDQALLPGTYEVDFDGTGYPSGVYFCRLSASKFTQTIKMILLK